MVLEALIYYILKESEESYDLNRHFLNEETDALRWVFQGHSTGELENNQLLLYLLSVFSLEILLKRTIHIFF